jgi:hypothetical protein
MLPANYYESRRTFIDLAQGLGAELRSFAHEDALVDGVPLSTDTAYLGPKNAATLVLVSSGTHGVEAYAGAACQFHFLRQYRENFQRDGIAYLVVHAVNPWGYFHDRRVTREGVDLNRNFVDFPLAAQPPSGYGTYHGRLVERFRPLPRGGWNELTLLSSALTRKRRRALQVAVTTGQYEHADGLFYGGSAPTTSRRVWERILQTYAMERERAFLLDLHTGLGKRGDGELISYLPPSAPEFMRMSEWFEGSLHSQANGDSVSAAVEGTLTAGFDKMVEGETYAVGLEFGTRPALSVLYALRADHWYHNNAAQFTAAQRDYARRKMKRAFSVPEADWKEQIVARFDEVMRQLVRGLEGRSNTAAAA